MQDNPVLFTRKNSYHISKLVKKFHSLPNISRKTNKTNKTKTSRFREKTVTGTTPHKREPIKTTMKKRIRIYSPLNKTQRYLLDTPEKQYKKTTPIIGLNKCIFSPNRLKFPCIFQKTVFENRAELESYLEMKKEKNRLTGYKTKREHYKETADSLKSLGMRLKKSRVNM